MTTQKTTSTGYAYSIDERIKTDWDFLKAVQKLQENPSNVNAIEDVCIKLLTEKGFVALKKHIAKQNDGYCPIQSITNEILEMIKGDETLKK